MNTAPSTWKTWATTFAVLAFLTLGMPVIVSLPLPAAALIILATAALIILITAALARAQR